MRHLAYHVMNGRAPRLGQSNRYLLKVWESQYPYAAGPDGVYPFPVAFKPWIAARDSGQTTAKPPLSPQCPPMVTPCNHGY
jgi:hypothetical protein